VALGLALVASTAAGQTNWAISAGGGGIVPVGEWSNTAANGWIAYLSGAYRFDSQNRVPAIRLDVSYGENEGRAFPAPPSGFTYPKIKQLNVLAYLQLHVAPTSEKLDVYLGAGGGASRLTIVASRSGKTFSSTKGALSALVGLAYPIAGTLDILGEGRGIMVFNGTFNPTTGAAANLNELAFTLGLRLRF